MSTSEKQEEDGEKTVQRPDKGWNIPVVNHAAALLAHSPAGAAY